MNNWKIAIGFMIGLNSFVAMASLYRLQAGAFLAIAATLAVLGLVYFKKIQSTIPIYLFAVSLALMWQASMFGAHVIGSDMHGEYYASRVILSEGNWDLARHYGTQSSTSIVVGALVPSISKLLYIDIVWVYKAVLPFLFAFTPVVLYYIYKQMIGERYGYYAALFFMIVPITTLEIVQIGKSMVAELFMALAILAAVTTTPMKITLPRIFMISAFSITAMLAHYTVGIALLAFLIGIAVVRFMPRLNILSKKAMPVFVLPVVIVLLSASGFVYYSIADQGVIVKVMAKVVPTYGRIISNTASDTITDFDINVLNPTNPPSAVTKGNVFERQEVLVKAGIGMDFAEASIPGKSFRVVQFLTQFLIIIGGLILFWAHRHYKFTAEFVAAIWSSYFLLSMCVFVPEFSNIINITRFYHFALFFLAPVFVIGAVHLFKKESILVVLLVIYFAFTSGLVFESSGSNKISEIDTPYSVGLSAERTGVIGTYVRSDLMAVEWLERYGKGDTMIVGDYNGWHLVSAYLGMGRLRENQARHNPTFDNLPDKQLYIFVTDWNTRHGQYIDSLRGVRGGAGLRASYPLPEFDFPIVFQSGNSIIFEKGE